MEAKNKASVKYGKSELMKSKRFLQDRDILKALLNDEERKGKLNGIRWWNIYSTE